MGLYLQNNNDFIHLSKTGMSVYSLGSEEKREIVRKNTENQVIHSLESYNFLKIDKNNFIYFDCAMNNSTKIIIKDEYTKKGDDKFTGKGI